MPVIQIAENVYSVGAVDYDVREFHGYLTPYGATYNAYLIMDEKITLIDSVKGPFTEELLQNVRELCPLDKVEILISNHAEPDHSGAYPRLAAACKNATLYATAACEKNMAAYYGKLDIPFVPVKSGDTLSSGKYSYTFLATPMVHWPDNMVTYSPELKTLFSNDAFGQHIATKERFVDEIGLEKTMERASDYYANIIMALGTQVNSVLKAASALDIQMIAPSHGLIWRTNIGDIVQKYSDWANNVTNEKKMVIAYDTMWGSTCKMAAKIAEEYRGKGMEVEVFDLKRTHISTVMAALIDAKYIAVGSSTLNRGMLPPVAAFLCYMKGLSPKNRIGLAFGSHGWSGEGVPLVAEALTAMGWEILENRKAVFNPEV